MELSIASPLSLEQQNLRVVCLVQNDWPHLFIRSKFLLSLFDTFTSSRNYVLLTRGGSRYLFNSVVQGWNRK